MFCNKCGEKLPDDAKFCTKCGYKVNNDPEMGSIVFKRLGQLYGSIAQIRRKCNAGGSGFSIPFIAFL